MREGFVSVDWGMVGCGMGFGNGVGSGAGVGKVVIGFLVGGLGRSFS